jgi:HAD superfamily hydrolase (TIGR01509 family)
VSGREQPRPPRGLLFDLDGTLVDTEPLHFESQNRVMVELGSPPMPAEEFERYVGWCEEAFWAEVARDYSLVPTPRELADLRTRALLELFETATVPVLDGVRELLEEAGERGIPCAVASSSPRRQIEATLERADLLRFIGACRSGHDDVVNGKPAPDVYLAAAEALGVPAEHCLALEDSRTGVASARAAGCFVIAVPCVSHPDPDLGAAHLRLRSMREVPGLL